MENYIVDYGLLTIETVVPLSEDTYICAGFRSTGMGRQFHPESQYKFVGLLDNQFVLTGIRFFTTPTNELPLWRVDTPTQAPTPHVNVYMPDMFFTTGETCYCKVTVTTQRELTDMLLVVILDVFGVLTYGPAFSEEFDFYQQNFSQGASEVVVIPEFKWPAGTGFGQGLVFYSGLTNATVSRLESNIDSFAFGWNGTQ